MGASVLRRIVGHEGAFLGAIFLAAVALCAGFNAFLFRGLSFDPDTTSYLFQAKLFAQGRLHADAPPEPGFSSSPHINIDNGKWYSKYPFGNALALTPGVWLRAPWLVPAVLTGLSLVLLYLLVKDTFGRRAAVFAAVIGLVSPATIMVGATWLSEVTSRFFLSVFLFALVRMLKRRHWGYAVLSGFALGYAFNTRPPTALAFGTAGAIIAAMAVVREAKPLALVRLLGLFLIPFAGMVGAMLAWNALLTGAPLRFTHTAVATHDRIGFGLRAEGFSPDLTRAESFGPAAALSRIWPHIIPCIAYHTLGWGEYSPPMFRVENRADSAMAGLIIKSASSNDWVVLKLRGYSDGTSRIQFQSRADERPSWWSTETIRGFHERSGRAGIELRLMQNQGRTSAWFRRPGQEVWSAAGTITNRMAPPCEVGIVTGLGGYGRMRAVFRSLVLDGEGLQSDRFEGSLSPVWRWSAVPRTFRASAEGGLAIEPRKQTDLETGERAARLYQVTDAENFSIQAELEATWAPDPFRWVKAILLLLPLGLAAIPFFEPAHHRWALAFYGVLALNLLVYFFHYFEGSTWGYTLVNVRYYAEAILLAVIPLVAAGADVCYERFLKSAGAGLRIVVGTALIALMVNTACTYARFIPVLQNWQPWYQKLPLLVEEAGLRHAVVFVPGIREAPNGDYPFQPLESANVVYFKLGPDPVWNLNNSDWRQVYRQYFQGREAFMFDSVRLKRLAVE